MNRRALSAALGARRLLTVVLLAFSAGTSVAAAKTAASTVPLLAAVTTPWPASEADALRVSAGGDLLVQRVYEATGWRLPWTDVATEALQSSLASRGRHGLDRAQLIEALPPSARPAQRDVSLTRSALRYAAALAHGVSDPATLHEIHTIPLQAADLATPLGQALAKDRLEAWLASLAPQDEGYSRLSQAYLRESAQIGAVMPPDIKGGVIHMGDTDSRVAKITTQLIADEYLAAPSNKAGQAAPVDQAVDQAIDQALYTLQIADAVSRLQRDYGLAAEWQAARKRNRQGFVDLPREIPVRLIYQNVFIDGDGEIVFRTDPYGWNAPIAKALGFENVSDRRVRTETVDISP